KAHIEKELLQSLDGVRTAFDGGAGSGRFSSLLAKRGIHVTHFDISLPMLEKAKELAAAEGVLENITFVQGALEDLSAYGDGSFDLVMSFDAPISYTWPNHEKVISELIRIARKRILFSVSSRLGSVPYLANPLQKHQFILNCESDDSWVQWCLRSKDSMVEHFAFNRQSCETALESGLMGDAAQAQQAYDRGETPWPITYLFMPDELQRILQQNGVSNISLAGPGAFARTIPNEILVKIMNDPAQRQDFLDFCYTYDRNPYVCGLGKDNLLAAGEITKEF
ncbi:MAG: class I SAM-dependent methyltransferase, partial [Oscillospiraceae bacterium]|nr:class I SAM-dependent methyltransferase [Oscillospiraceae bacterium]